MFARHSFSKWELRRPYTQTCTYEKAPEPVLLSRFEEVTGGIGPGSLNGLEKSTFSLSIDLDQRLKKKFKSPQEPDRYIFFNEMGPIDNIQAYWLLWQHRQSSVVSSCLLVATEEWGRMLPNPLIFLRGTGNLDFLHKILLFFLNVGI